MTSHYSSSYFALPGGASRPISAPTTNPDVYFSYSCIANLSFSDIIPLTFRYLKTLLNRTLFLPLIKISEPPQLRRVQFHSKQILDR